MTNWSDYDQYVVHGVAVKPIWDMGLSKGVDVVRDDEMTGGAFCGEAVAGRCERALRPCTQQADVTLVSEVELRQKFLSVCVPRKRRNMLRGMRDIAPQGVAVETIDLRTQPCKLDLTIELRRGKRMQVQRAPDLVLIGGSAFLIEECRSMPRQVQLAQGGPDAQ
jgi:hypothetical protein